MADNGQFADDFDVYVSGYNGEERHDLAVVELAIDIAMILYDSGRSRKSWLPDETNPKRSDSDECFDGWSRG
jgi:hypothetical protein